jgi:opacity protein-like surface antigen
VSVHPLRTVLLGALLVVALCAVAEPTAQAAGQPWNGRYTVMTYASQKAGTSRAARQPEPDFSAVFTFATACSTAACYATVVDGPAPTNLTIPQPTRYTWDGAKWALTYDWQWECFQGEGMPRMYSPATSWVTYTPQPDGTLSGTWYTDINDGPCRGNVLMPVAAAPA